MVFAAPAAAGKILKALRSHRYGKYAAIAGRMLKEKKPQVRMNTSIGGSRIMLMLEGEQQPRIC